MRFAVALLFLQYVQAQEWRYYGGDAGGMKYSPLKQINKTNVASLKPAWTFHTGEISDGKTQLTRTSFEATPLVIDGVMYLTTPYARLIALDPETGRQKWAFDPKLDKTRPANLHINRGSAFCSDGRSKRIFYARWMRGCSRLPRPRGSLIRRLARVGMSTCAMAWRISFPIAAMG